MNNKFINNQINNISVEFSNNRKILSLRDQNIKDEVLKKLADGLKLSSSIHLLDLSWNNIGTEGGFTLAEIVTYSTSLRELRLSHNNLGIQGIKSLAEGLKLNSSICLLDLSWNNIGTLGATTLASLLEINFSIQELNLRNNGIEHEGIVKLAEKLKQNSTLRNVNFNTNNAGNEGAMAFAEMLRSNTTLQVLDLSSNDIGNIGTSALAASFKTTLNLRVFSFLWNTVDISVAKLLIASLHGNTCLVELSLFDYSINQALVKEVDEMKKESKSLISYNNNNTEYQKIVLKVVRIINKLLIDDQASSLPYTILKEIDERKSAMEYCMTNIVTYGKVGIPLDFSKYTFNVSFSQLLCKKLSPREKTYATNIHISRLPNELLCNITKFLSPYDIIITTKAKGMELIKRISCKEVKDEEIEEFINLHKNCFLISYLTEALRKANEMRGNSIKIILDTIIKENNSLYKNK